jgi:hypothetical protein
LKDGKCLAVSSADCQRSGVCAQVKRCQAKDGVCINVGGKGGDKAASNQPPDKVGSTTLGSVFR